VVVGRDRPPVPTVGSTYATASFPSGHVGSTIVLYGSIALVVGALTGSRAWRAGLLALTAVLAAIVGFCRMERGFHYPTDVAAGVVIGVTWLWATWHLLVRANHDAAPPPEAAASVAWAVPAEAVSEQPAVR
jgi:undecaprenyl-diphosphatase